MAKLRMWQTCGNQTPAQPAVLNTTRLALPLVVLSVVLSTGCSTLQLPAGLQPFTESQVASVEPSESPEPLGEYEILMKPRFGKGSRQTATITENALVQQVLESSRATKKFRGMEIMIFRSVERSPVPLKIMPKYDAQTDSVPPGQNYAIQPGDQILIEEQSNSSISKALDLLSGS